MGGMTGSSEERGEERGDTGRVEGSDERNESKIVHENEDMERLEGKYTALELQSGFFFSVISMENLTEGLSFCCERHHGAKSLWNNTRTY